MVDVIILLLVLVSAGIFLAHAINADPAQSKRLHIGQHVAWHDRADDQGTVSASDWSGVRIEWDNGKNQFFHHNNMGEVEIAKPNLV